LGFLPHGGPARGNEKKLPERAAEKEEGGREEKTQTLTHEALIERERE